jgi:putative peptidoglycan lipid II flippase
VSTTKRAGIVGLAIFSSRIFGLLRDQVFAWMFGAGKLQDAFVAAFRIPNLLRDLFAEGALSTAFTTQFTKSWEKEGEAKTWELASLVITAAITVLGLICVAGILASPWIVYTLNHGFLQTPGKFELTVALTRVLFPFILFVSLAAVVMGMLNARFLFGLPASASTAFNIVSIVGGVALAYVFDPQSDWKHPHFTERALYGVCLGVLLGGIAQLLIQLPALFQLGFRFRWQLNFRDPRVQAVWELMWPSFVAASAVQINVMVNGFFASNYDGGQSWLAYAFRLMQFPIGVFGVAIASVILPTVSRHEARGDLAAFGASVQEGMRLAIFFCLPSTLGLAVLAEPIIRVIYEHGRFHASDTLQTAHALQAYVIGLTGYAVIKVLVPCFAALQDTKFPLRVSLIGIVLNLMLNAVATYGLHLAHVGVAFSTGCIALINATQLFLALRRRIDCGPWTHWLRYGLQMLSASVLCAACAGFVEWKLTGWQHGLWWRQAVVLALAVGDAVLVFVAVGYVLNVPELKSAFALVRRKLSR